MQWVLAFHIIFMVCWFAGLFYLPRLYVYHAEANDELSLQRFVVMEHRLYYYIMTPAAWLTTLFGLWRMSANWGAYFQMGWMHAKLFCVVLLWVYHIYCGHIRRVLITSPKQYSSLFLRFFNEVPTILLVAIVLLVVVRPW